MRCLRVWLGDYDAQWRVLDPKLDGQEVIYNSLADDIESVYVWLKAGLLRLDDGSIGEVFAAAWDWRFNYDIHAGEHLTGLVRALYFIVRRDPTRS